MRRNLIVEGYRRSYKVLKKSEIYIFTAFLVIFFTAVVGFLFPGLFEDEVLKIIQNIMSQLEGKSTVELIFYIFFNNFKASLFSMLLGVVFGIFPLISGMLNGYVIGFSANVAVSEAGVLVLWRLLPHGVFEIPAIVFSMGIGFYLGSRLLERKFKIKSEVKRIAFILLICILILPFGFIYYTLAMDSLNFGFDFAVLTTAQMGIMILVAVVNIVLLFIVGVTVYSFVSDEVLRKELSDSLVFFVLVVIPLLIVAGLIEGILVGALG